MLILTWHYCTSDAGLDISFICIANNRPPALLNVCDPRSLQLKFVFYLRMRRVRRAETEQGRTKPRREGAKLERHGTGRERGRGRGRGREGSVDGDGDGDGTGTGTGTGTETRLDGTGTGRRSSEERSA